MLASAALNVLIASQGAIRIAPGNVRVPIPSIARKSSPELGQYYDLYAAPRDAADLDQPLPINMQPRPIGVRKRLNDVERENDWIRSVHVWFVNDDGEVLMQKREKGEEFAGKWDVSCRGELTAADSTSKAAVKEISDDIGLRMDEKSVELMKFCTVPHSPVDANGNRMPFAERVNEYQDMYVIPAPVAVKNLDRYLSNDVVFVPCEELFRAWIEYDPAYVWRPDHYRHELEAAIVRMGHFGYSGWRNNEPDPYVYRPVARR
mmetsp:Transcript_25901/g.69973  ORF Transcript_25901/g.69973 Transcript_25901/m.69973 type:complete len:262 (+) Transcript_25901:76-861(+)|eukprot:CAMPEP_0185178198 /NCGR_PEP_ID=MMETSP1139-20130426/30857_1 /TAXON_ID=298111 /ORGANISM="Pavlova sp., Strain CCMP459" /LENGTH=261 /DNA_ID=CAMNT_0027744011 /DNA_START=83 /DNA_END=868 /DNA_ORIENTATION=-